MLIFNGFHVLGKVGIVEAREILEKLGYQNYL